MANLTKFDENILSHSIVALENTNKITDKSQINQTLQMIPFYLRAIRPQQRTKDLEIDIKLL